jgi:RHS repeat-associated protein
VAPSGSASYYLSDQVDSVTVVLDDGGKIVTQHEYLPFGETWITEGDKKNAPKYNSQELDRETGYYFYNARHYDPEISRFVTADNIVDGEYDTQGWNRFAYVHNNPIRYKDPTGHESELNYTQAQGAQKKQQIDTDIAKEGTKIDSKSGEYWGKYIQKVSNGRVTVDTKAKGYQYFLVKDGWEGFMQKDSKEIGWKNQYAPDKQKVKVKHDFTDGDKVDFYTHMPITREVRCKNLMQMML